MDVDQRGRFVAILNDYLLFPTVRRISIAQKRNAPPPALFAQQPLPLLHLQPFRRTPSYVIRLRDSGDRGPTLPLPVLPATRRSCLANSWTFGKLYDLYDRFVLCAIRTCSVSHFPTNIRFLWLILSTTVLPFILYFSFGT